MAGALEGGQYICVWGLSVWRVGVGGEGGGSRWNRPWGQGRDSTVEGSGMRCALRLAGVEEDAGCVRVEVRAAGMVQGEMLVTWSRVARVEVGKHGLFCVCVSLKFFMDVIVDSHSVVRNNTKRFLVHFVQFLPIVIFGKTIIR